MSCEAFFIQTVREVIDPDLLPCQDLQWKCGSNLEQLSKCRKCRYLKCIQAGMKKELVTAAAAEAKCEQLFHPDEETGWPYLHVEPILAQFRRAEEEMKTIHGVETLISNIVSAHKWDLSTLTNMQTMLMKTKSYHKLLFQDFAERLPYFLSLTEADQSTLITRNSKLYYIYILGHYANADNGFEQLTWLLGSNLPPLGEKVILPSKTLIPSIVVACDL